MPYYPVVAEVVGGSQPLTASRLALIQVGSEVDMVEGIPQVMAGVPFHVKLVSANGKEIPIRRMHFYKGDKECKPTELNPIPAPSDMEAEIEQYQYTELGGDYHIDVVYYTTPGVEATLVQPFRVIAKVPTVLTLKVVDSRGKLVLPRSDGTYWFPLRRKVVVQPWWTPMKPLGVETQMGSSIIHPIVTESAGYSLLEENMAVNSDLIGRSPSEHENYDVEVTDDRPAKVKAVASAKGSAGKFYCSITIYFSEHESTFPVVTN